jgi:hypothetical protein
MVITRSMHARLNRRSEVNIYNPNTRISLVNKENLRNQSITLFDMFDIYNDIRYKANKNNGIVLDEDLNPLLFSITGIFRNSILSTKLKINKLISDTKLINMRQNLKILLDNLHNIDIGIRQTSVNSGFGDLDTDNEVLYNFTDSQIESIFDRVLTPCDIKGMNLFEYVIKDYNEYIDLIRDFVKKYAGYEYHFGTELSENNFIDGSIHAYVSKLVWK